MTAVPSCVGRVPLVFAHRGAAIGVAENTRAALTAALAAGADGVEIDIRLTRDGVAVLSHDPALARVAGCDLAVGHTDLVALRSAFPDLLTLDDALALLMDRPVVLDVKDRVPERYAPLYRMAGSHRHPALAVSVYDLAMSDAAAAGAPGRPRLGLLDEGEEIDCFLAAGGEWLRLWGRPGLAAADLDAVRTRGARVMVVVGHRDYPDTLGETVLRHVLSLGPDAVMLDDPAAAVTPRSESAAPGRPGPRCAAPG